MSNSACLNGGATLFLTTLTRHAVADGLGALLERLDAADVEPHRRVELERTAAGGGLGRAEHHADLLAQLVGEDADRAGAVEVTGELAQRLAHQAGLQADERVAHLALDLGLRHQCRHGVDHETSSAPERTSISAISSACSPLSGCDTQQIVDVRRRCGARSRVHRMLGVDERRQAALALRLGDDVVAERRLARGLGAEDLDDASARDAADAEREVERQRSRSRSTSTATCDCIPHAS